MDKLNENNKDSSKKADVSRRDFTALSVAAGLAVGAGGPPAYAADQVMSRDVNIKTPDGTCDAAFFYPATGAHAGVVVWTDIFGLRPSFRDLGKRLAGEGFAVLVPNPFYRTAKSPVVVDASTFDFNSPEDRAKTAAWTGPINQAGAIERDATAHIAFLDAQKEVDKNKKMGTQGYCMGGPLVFKTASVSSRIGAGATFHGGGLVTDKPDSPHLLIPKMKSRMYIAIAASDDTRQPDAKDTLKKTFADAHVPAEVTVYEGTIHGWCVRDMPPQNGKPIYSRPDAERAWGHLLSLYKTSLA
jgi:carboxymethylenebutenolidase